MNEFQIISDYFLNLTPAHDQLILGIGDDAAIWKSGRGKQTVLTVDTLHVNRHFLPDCPPSSVAHKALAVNLSDCAAMGAKPVGFLLSLSMPKADERWLVDFCKGLQALANQYEVVLMGGDTTQGPLSVSITLMGEIKPNHELRRSGAKVGDDIYVSGTLGLPSLGLAILRDHRYCPEAAHDEAVQAYREPQPQIILGQSLLKLANACIDISDGFASDLTHILTASQCGARVMVDQLPISPLVKEYAADAQQALDWCLSGGDDYQLIFTVAPGQRKLVAELAEKLNIPLTRVGQITPGCELICQDAAGETVDLARKGWEHFADE